MHKIGQEKATSTPRRIFPLSPEMVRRLHAVTASDLLKARKTTTDQKQAA